MKGINILSDLSAGATPGQHQKGVDKRNPDGQGFAAFGRVVKGWTW
jgi:hypothetical protein